MDHIPDCTICDYLKNLFYKHEEKKHIDYHSSDHINYLKTMEKKYAKYKSPVISKIKKNILNKEENYLEKRRKNIKKRQQRIQNYIIERDAINACEINREKERKLFYFWMKIKRFLHL